MCLLACAHWLVWYRGGGDILSCTSSRFSTASSCNGTTAPAIYSRTNGYPRVVQEAGHAFYKRWTGPNFPRVLLVQIQHANPYYDDSYAVNSENVGPYGHALTHELIPQLERT